jgi:orotate phosphoribosyltransferase
MACAEGKQGRLDSRSVRARLVGAHAQRATGVTERPGDSRKELAGRRGELIEELRRLLLERSVQRGDFVLASGDRSSYYFDSRATVLSPRGSELIGEVLFDLLKGRGIEAVGGLAMGATFLAVAVALVSGQHGQPIHGFTVRDEKKGHGLRKSIEESFHPDGRPLLCPGRRVAIVEDVVTKGGSVLKAIDAVLERGCSIDVVLAIVDRGAGGGEAVTSRGLDYVPIFRADQEGNLVVDERVGVPGRTGAAGR